MKNPRRMIVSFFVKLLLAYSLFLALWVGINDWYPRQMQTIGTEVFRSAIQTIDSQWVVMLKSPDAVAGRFDTSLLVLNKKTHALGQQPISSLSIAYLPMAMTLSLIMASPVSWKRRVIALILGCVFVGLWVAFSIFCMVLNAYCGQPPLGLYTVAPIVATVLSFITWVVSVSTIPQFVVPIFFWLLATIRREDIQRRILFKQDA